ncbi:MAG: lysophospholipid acyltransferase family protein [Salinarimonas sp.]
MRAQALQALEMARRAVTIGVKAMVLVIVFFLLYPPHAIALRLHAAPSRRIPILFHRLACRLIGLRILETGERPHDVPVLILSNHSSWIDIIALASLAPVSFVAKSEIAGWPVFGTLARLQRSIFIDRNDRRATGEAAASIARRLARGEWIVLFAEGTTSDGNRVYPFRAPLVGAARLALAQAEQGGSGGSRESLRLQPLAITYLRRNGLPLTRLERPDLCWYGRMDLVPHLAGILSGGPIDVLIHWGEPLAFEPGSDRKQLTREAWAQVRHTVSAANAGRFDPATP